MGGPPKIGGFYPQNEWFISWKTPMNQMDDLGGFYHSYFWRATLFPSKSWQSSKMSQT